MKLFSLARLPPSASLSASSSSPSSSSSSSSAAAASSSSRSDDCEEGDGMAEEEGGSSSGSQRDDDGDEYAEMSAANSSTYDSSCGTRSTSRGSAASSARDDVGIDDGGSADSSRGLGRVGGSSFGSETRLGSRDGEASCIRNEEEEEEEEEEEDEDCEEEESLMSSESSMPTIPSILQATPSREVLSGYRPKSGHATSSRSRHRREDGAIGVSSRIDVDDAVSTLRSMEKLLLETFGEDKEGTAGGGMGGGGGLVIPLNSFETRQTLPPVDLEELKAVLERDSPMEIERLYEAIMRELEREEDPKKASRRRKVDSIMDCYASIAGGSTLPTNLGGTFHADSLTTMPTKDDMSLGMQTLQTDGAMAQEKAMAGKTGGGNGAGCDAGRGGKTTRRMAGGGKTKKGSNVKFGLAPASARKGRTGFLGGLFARKNTIRGGVVAKRNTDVVVSPAVKTIVGVNPDAIAIARTDPPPEQDPPVPPPTASGASARTFSTPFRGSAVGGSVVSGGRDVRRRDDDDGTDSAAQRRGRSAAARTVPDANGGEGGDFWDDESRRSKSRRLILDDGTTVPNVPTRPRKNKLLGAKGKLSKVQEEQEEKYVTDGKLLLEDGAVVPEKAMTVAPKKRLDGAKRGKQPLEGCEVAPKNAPEAAATVGCKKKLGQGCNSDATVISKKQAKSIARGKSSGATYAIVSVRNEKKTAEDGVVAPKKVPEAKVSAAPKKKLRREGKGNAISKKQSKASTKGKKGSAASAFVSVGDKTKASDGAKTLEVKKHIPREVESPIRLVDRLRGERSLAPQSLEAARTNGIMGKPRIEPDMHSKSIEVVFAKVSLPQRGEQADAAVEEGRPSNEGRRKVNAGQRFASPIRLCKVSSPQREKQAYAAVEEGKPSKEEMRKVTAGQRFVSPIRLRSQDWGKKKKIKDRAKDEANNKSSGSKSASMGKGNGGCTNERGIDPDDVAKPQAIDEIACTMSQYKSVESIPQAIDEIACTMSQYKSVESIAGKGSKTSIAASLPFKTPHRTKNTQKIFLRGFEDKDASEDDISFVERELLSIPAQLLSKGGHWFNCSEGFILQQTYSC